MTEIRYVWTADPEKNKETIKEKKRRLLKLKQDVKKNALSRYTKGIIKRKGAPAARPSLWETSSQRQKKHVKNIFGVQ